ncbi:hypothetical protein J5N97_030202 [Dioscorea zingiberensis]|uniref:Fe2OG dioxygenase domain-containing protein n=1 Tax=Dioscorea zingiberensis TaxID=325984 RepID=A0A9D5H410_9LILI|nr:hypothetical protein J5N97_030202 [Dioscorea zingiberensis]
MVDQLMRHRVLDIYVQCLDVRHDMTLPETLQSDSDDMELEGRQAPRDIVELDGMEEIMGYANDRPDRPKERSIQPASDTLGLDERPGKAVRDSVNQENTSDNSSNSGKDDEEMLADIPFINQNSDTDNEKEEARDKLKRFVQLRRVISQDANDGDDNAPNDGDANAPGETNANEPHEANAGPSIEIGKEEQKMHQIPTHGMRQGQHIIMPMLFSQRQKMEGKALKGKEKTEGTQGSLKVIKGACIDGVILGREAPHQASFITVTELNVYDLGAICNGLWHVLNEFATKSREMLDYVLKTMAKSLELNEDSFISLFGGRSVLDVRFNNYPSCSRPDLVNGIKPHSDSSALTIILPNKDVEGLQVLKDDIWVKVTTNPHALILNMGDLMEIMSNGIFKSLVYRVVTNMNKARIYVAFFYTPDGEAEIGPIDGLSSTVTGRERDGDVGSSVVSR